MREAWSLYLARAVYMICMALSKKYCLLSCAGSIDKCYLKNVYTTVQKFWVKIFLLKKWIVLFSKDALNLPKVTVKTFSAFSYRHNVALLLSKRFSLKLCPPPVHCTCSSLTVQPENSDDRKTAASLKVFSAELWPEKCTERGSDNTYFINSVFLCLEICGSEWTGSSVIKCNLRTWGGRWEILTGSPQ